ncbi:MAG: efflux RND transporter periplasmic adaptor subunit [Oligoflexia bacterium]|nr:efflux RND transporter periplasmic adaptor subunit [Oligoflexia bacterium]
MTLSLRLSQSLFPLLLALPLALPLTLAACGQADADMVAAASDDSLVPTVPEAVPEANDVRVEVVKIEGSDATLDVTVPAEVKGARDALLASPTGGYVEKVYVSEGDAVRRGAKLVAIDRASATARKAQAAAHLAQAQSDLARIQKLGDTASDQQLTRTKTQVDLAQAAFDLASIAWQRALVTAPFDGVVVQIGVEVGEVAGPGSPLARLVQLDPVVVSMSVSDRDVVSLRTGMAVDVQTDANASALHGILDAIAPAADLKTRSFVVKASIPNPDHALLPGMVARVSISDKIATDAVVIPQEWLVTRIDGVGVFLVEDGVARWRPVHAGRVVHDQIVIDQGLSVGDTIVSTGQRSLVDGDALLVARSGTCCVQGRPSF